MPGISFGRGRRGGGGKRWLLRLGLAAVVAVVSLIGFCTATGINPYTGEKQRVAMTPGDEVAFGLQAMPDIVREFGGPARSNPEASREVKAVGQTLITAIEERYGVREHPYQYQFTLLEDDDTINAFALPGGPTFITEALYRAMEQHANELGQTPEQRKAMLEAMLAGVMGHEVGHVVHRHGAERMARVKLQQGLTQAAVVAAGDYSAGQAAAMMGGIIQNGYSREDELESDHEGLELMSRAGYDPRAMIEVMRVLDSSGGGGGAPGWARTHPTSQERIDRIEQWIEQRERSDGVAPPSQRETGSPGR